MKYIWLKIAAAAAVSLAVSSAAVHAESAAIRNCTWCHSGSAQGYTPAPRLAGQHPKYIEKQLVNFREHTRDGPFSKQYMWGAAAHLSAGAARSLAIYFSTIPPKAANDGDREVVATGREIYQVGVRIPTLRPALLAMAQMRRALAKSPVWEDWRILT